MLEQKTTATGTTYRRVGDRGPWVVLVQGLGLSSSFWLDLPERLARRAGSELDVDGPVRVLAVDNRGTGGAPLPRRGRVTLAEMADDVARVLDAEGADRAYVAGISMGGMIAQHLAVRHRDRARGLVLLATMPGLAVAQWPSPRTLMGFVRLPLARGRSAQALVRSLLVAPGEERAAQEMFRAWASIVRREPLHARTFFAHLGAVASGHWLDRELGSIACPVEIVVGSHDVLVPRGNGSRLAARIASARLVELEGAGHLLAARYPDVVPDALGRLRARAERGGA